MLSSSESTSTDLDHAFITIATSHRSDISYSKILSLRIRAFRDSKIPFQFKIPNPFELPSCAKYSTYAIPAITSKTHEKTNAAPKKNTGSAKVMSEESSRTPDPVRNVERQRKSGTEKCSRHGPRTFKWMRRINTFVANWAEKQARRPAIG